MKNPTPKQRFQESNDNISKHRKLVDSPEYQRSIDFARLEYSRILAESANDQTKAMVAGIKMQAVEEFLIQLKWLGEVEEVRPALRVVDTLPDPSTPKRQ